MPTARDEQRTIQRFLRWLSAFAITARILDEFVLFQELLRSTPTARRRVDQALEAIGAPNSRDLTRKRYYALTKTEFDQVLEALLAELKLSLDEARELFCVKLQWCKRKADLKGWIRKMLRKVPKKFRGVLTFIGAAAPWVWDAITILLTLAKKVEVTIFLMRLSAYLAIGALNKLCRC